ncbi:hypothetical protein EDB87DRAFT_1667914 [Lactarius vividus]|nr:hypothetical protein EDB87DRAFT_1667914 [Lactarius vividus]
MRTILFSSHCVRSSAAKLSTCFSWCPLMVEMSVSVLSRCAFNAVRLASIAERRELVSTAGGAGRSTPLPLYSTHADPSLALEPFGRPRPRFAPTGASTFCVTSACISGAPTAGRAGTSRTVRGRRALGWDGLASLIRHTLVEWQALLFFAQALQAKDLLTPCWGSQTVNFPCLHASQRSLPLATHSSSGPSSLSSPSALALRRRRCLGGASGD